MNNKGQGISGQVFKCMRHNDNGEYAMKIIKNKKAWKNQALIELKILEFLNKEVDKDDCHHIIRLVDYFCYHEHLCIVFELLNENLYELLKHNYFQGISLNSIRFIMKQILEAVYQFQKANLIHCDLKPENILLKIDKDNPKSEIVIKITDFGSACFKNHTMFTYIQSRYYRAPEVIIGNKYSCEIDMWSIGCIAAELYLGEPLLPGACEYDQLVKIESLIGEMPQHMIRGSRNGNKYYKYKENKFKMKSPEDYYKDNPNDMEPKYQIPSNLKSLDDLLTNSRKESINKDKKSHNHSQMSMNSSTMENNELAAFVHFLKGLLVLDPRYRWNAKQSLRHPFITKEKFEGFYNLNHEEVSQFLFHSVDASYFSDKGGRGVNKKFYTQMKPHNAQYGGGTNPFMSHNISYNNYSSNLGTYSSGDMSVYQPNVGQIPMKLLKNFPYAKMDEMNFKPQRNNHLQFHPNNTYMNVSFDKLHGNNSYYTNGSSEYYLQSTPQVNVIPTHKHANSNKYLPNPTNNYFVNFNGNVNNCSNFFNQHMTNQSNRLILF